MAVSIVTVARWPLLRGARYDMAGFRHELEVETRHANPNPCLHLLLLLLLFTRHQTYF